METEAKDALTKAELGKPASSGKTIVAKTAAVISFATSGASIAIGAVALLSGRKLGEGFFKKVLNFSGGTAVVGGALVGITGKAVWDSASSASRTRNYLKLSEQLNSKESAQQR